MINSCAKFEVTIFTNYDNTKGNKKCIKLGDLRGSPKVIGSVAIYDRSHTTSHSCLTETACISYQDIANYLSNVADYNLYPNCIWYLVGVIPFEFRRDLWRRETMGNRAMLFMRDPQLGCFDTTSACDGQTHDNMKKL